MGYAKHVLPSHPLPLLAAAGLGLKPSNPPCRLLLVKMGKPPSRRSYSANHIMALKAFLHDYLVFNFKWVFWGNSWEFVEYLLSSVGRL